MRILNIIIPLLICFFIGKNGVFAQDINVIVFKNLNYTSKIDAFLNNSPKRIILKEGKKIRFHFKESDKKGKGEIDKILFPFFIIVKNKHYSLKKFEYISFRAKGMHIKKITGALTFGFGAALAGGAVYMGNEIANEPELPYPMKVTPLTMASTAIGIGVVLVGIDFMIKGIKLGYSGFSKKRIFLNDEKNWQVNVVDKKELKKFIINDDLIDKEKKTKSEKKKK